MPTFEDGTGFKNLDTAEAAARRLSHSGRAAELRKLVWGAYLNNPSGMTADECAEYLGLDRLSIRPRVSELFGDGQLVDSGTRRKNASGRGAAVFAVSTGVNDERAADVRTDVTMSRATVEDRTDKRERTEKIV
jgi:predicted ArsR family transcriptional regulator